MNTKCDKCKGSGKLIMVLTGDSLECAKCGGKGIIIDGKEYPNAVRKS